MASRGKKHTAARYSAIVADVENYYRGKIEEFGPVPRGVDWRDKGSQNLRFVQLMKIHASRAPFSLNDLGCGYAGLVAFLNKRFRDFSYRGCDVSRAMIAAARRTYARSPNVSFRVGTSPAMLADYTVASGIFNVKLGTAKGAWLEYILHCLNQMNRFSRVGFSFNCLTKYSDADRMRRDLYYADPSQLFDWCKRKYSRDVALLHDYGLFEFTILVRKIR